MNIPIIRLELQGMKHTLAMALTEYVTQMDADIQQAIERYCTAENLTQIIAETVQRTLDVVVQEEVKRFFEYGEGRKVVAAAVKEKLLARQTFTPLDEDEA